MGNQGCTYFTIKSHNDFLFFTCVKVSRLHYIFVMQMLVDVLKPGDNHVISNIN